MDLKYLVCIYRTGELHSNIKFTRKTNSVMVVAIESVSRTTPASMGLGGKEGSIPSFFAIPGPDRRVPGARMYGAQARPVRDKLHITFTHHLKTC